MNETPFQPVPADVEAIATKVVHAALLVHENLGPGLLESVYETCLCHELAKANVPFQRQQTLPILYDGLELNAELRLDLIVADCLIVELKAVEKLTSLFEAQLLTYLKLSGLRLGLLINFNSALLKDGLRRIVR